MSTLAVTVRSLGGVPLLQVSGDLAYGEDLEVVRDNATRLMNAGHAVLVVDLSGVGTTDSSGIGALLDVRHAAVEHGGHVILLRPSERLRTTLTVMRMTTAFEVFDDEPALLARIDDLATGRTPFPSDDSSSQVSNGQATRDPSRADEDDR